jgi:hypothetical protein
MKKAALTPLLFIAAGVSTGALVLEAGPDEVVFPRQEIPIYFTHDYHTRKPVDGLDGEGLSCDFCHENVGTSTHGSDRDIPGHGTCETCHEDWIGTAAKPAAAELCAKCHTDPNITISTHAQAKMVIPDPNINFAHKSHVDAGVACVKCHNNVPKKGVATRDDYPTMDRCIACHQQEGISTDCKTCHFVLPSGKLQLEFHEGKLSPQRLHAFAIHDAEFEKDHAAAVKRDKEYCSSCHMESFCVQCHDGVGRTMRYHPGDWLSVHFMKAKQDETRCQSCHRVQTFCIDCHVKSGVASVNPGALVTGLAEQTRRTVRTNGAVAIGPHPMRADGWLAPTSKNFHGFFVQRNVRACASCHQENFCVTCHMSGAGTFQPLDQRGGNPHGPNPQRLKGSTAGSKTARMCLKCHSPLDPNWR